MVVESNDSQQESSVHDLASSGIEDTFKAPLPRLTPTRRVKESSGYSTDCSGFIDSVCTNYLTPFPTSAL